jgi:hypothetical protein
MFIHDLLNYFNITSPLSIYFIDVMQNEQVVLVESKLVKSSLYSCIGMKQQSVLQ